MDKLKKITKNNNAQITKKKCVGFLGRIVGHARRNEWGRKEQPLYPNKSNEIGLRTISL